ncbi:MAG: gamma-glutamyltransferase [Pseudomonadota bacterium]|nr:gamma-glutamyltransferase [Pseudomonadota bacterium]
MRDLARPGRSPVHSTHGMACTSHPLSSETAIDVLRQGGNALDAAVAACAVQCVVEPESTGIGGDCFCLYAPEGSGDLIAYNGSGRAPGAATAEWYAGKGIRQIERYSPHAVTVPGSIEAWARLIEDYGTKPLAELLAPAIGLARDGYPISSRVSFDFTVEAPALKKDMAATRLFLPGGKAPRPGSIHRQPGLARTLERIARQGPDGFYAGPVAQEIVELLQKMGGLHTMQDFADAKGEYVAPISTDYRGHKVHECPPNGQGIIALLLLNILEGFETAAGGPLALERVVAEIEAGRRAYADRTLYVADPDQAEVPVEMLLSESHAAKYREEIRAAAKLGSPAAYSAGAHNSTVYICVVDKDRNVASFINTLFSPFGSCIFAPESGVMLQNRGQGFVLDPDHPNCIAPGKRPMHTIIPGMVTKDDRAVMPFGVMGGDYQAFGHMQLLSRFLEFRLDLQESMDMTRFFPDPQGDRVQIESTLPGHLAEDLMSLGYKLSQPVKPHGGSQAIWIDWEQGVLTGGSDPRKDGCAIGY